MNTTFFERLLIHFLQCEVILRAAENSTTNTTATGEIDVVIGAKSQSQDINAVENLKSSKSLLLPPPYSKLTSPATSSMSLDTCKNRLHY